MTNNTDYFHRMGDYLAFKIGRHFKQEVAVLPDNVLGSP